MKRRRHNSAEPIDKIFVLKMLITFIGVIITGRLFFLQVIRHDYYLKVEARDHYGSTTLPARRGEIFIKDYASGDLIRVATNMTLDTIFADPTKIKDPKQVADQIAPLIYDLDEERQKDITRVETEQRRAQTPEDLAKIKPLTDEELYKKYYDNLLNQIGQKVRSEIILSNNIEDEEVLKLIEKYKLPGILVEKNTIKAFPDKIGNKSQTAAILSQYIGIAPNRLEKILAGENRYVILKKKLKPEVTDAIQELLKKDKTRKDVDKIFTGIGLEEEYYRYYPENTLASNILGYVTSDGIGTYGIENKFDNALKGKDGKFETQRDGSVYGRQITVGDSLIQPAIDGENIVLTIDRSMQMEVEKVLSNAVEKYDADSGQAIVMDPKTGKIMAMAHYPTFDPNNFSNALETEEINLTPEQIESLIPIENEPDAFWFYRNELTHDRYKIFKETLKDGRIIYKRYVNWIGLEAYQNKAVQQPYEPGSTYKAITMASAIDDKDVTPNTIIHDTGKLEVDWNEKTQKYDYVISNVSTNQCFGTVTMTNVLEFSCNTGIGYVAKKMGKNLFYSYLMKFGFGERTGIEFENEHPGQIQHFNTWTESELVTHGFGQGVTATPIQMVAAYGALANHGVLMQPHIVEKVIDSNGKETVTQPVPVQRTISEETANKITAMLVSTVENGVANKAGVDNHYIAGKTGTSQTLRNGVYVKGAGTTITSVIGYGPIDNPKFVLFVKLDRPRTSEWSDSTAAIAFKEIATYLYDYFGIPPDKNI